jgi:putative transcription factor
MALTCEVCGNPIRTVPKRIMIDGAVLQVCQNCVGHGTSLGSPVTKPRPFGAHPVARGGLTETDLEVDPDYSTIVKQAREKMGLTQEALGRAMNVKPSVISHVESRKMKPDLILARALMHYLRVNLLVPSSELENPD